MVSLLKAWWGNSATAANDFRFEYLPKATGGDDYSHIAAGIIKGMMTWGQNPAVGGPDSEGERKALEKLDWLVVTDLFETETAAFWYRGGVSPAAIDTEVFLLPAACSYEKHGSMPRSDRYRGLSPASSLLLREAWQHFQQWPLGTVEVEGSRSNWTGQT